MDRETDEQSETRKPSACFVDGKYQLYIDLFLVLPGEMETETDGRTENLVLPVEMETETDGRTENLVLPG